MGGAEINAESGDFRVQTLQGPPNGVCWDRLGVVGEAHRLPVPFRSLLCVM